MLFPFIRRSLWIIPCLAMSVPGLVKAGEAKQAYKEREKAMESLKDEMSAIKKALKADKPVTALEPAKKIEKITQNLPALFPEGSKVGHSEAKPEIWTNWAAFEKVAKNAAVKAADLVKAAESGDKTKLETAANEMGAACKACHKDYRGD